MLNPNAAILGNVISTYNIALTDFRLDPEKHMEKRLTKRANVKIEHQEVVTDIKAFVMSLMNYPNQDYWGDAFSIGNALYENIHKHKLGGRS